MDSFKTRLGSHRKEHNFVYFGTATKNNLLIKWRSTKGHWSACYIRKTNVGCWGRLWW